MSTHITRCIICDKEIGCCEDCHALGCGGIGGDGGCGEPPYIEFCSIDHALELRKRLERSISNYYSIYSEAE